MPRLRHDRPGMTYACPACDRGGGVYERAGNGNATDHPDRPYRCEKCGVAFTYAIERPKKDHSLDTDRQQRLADDYGTNPSAVNAFTPENVGLSPIGARRGQAD